jgi:MSHA biogenesis protein MshQ
MIAFARVQPGGPGASNGSFSGSLGAFSAGIATANNLVWSEVGRGDLSATLMSSSYLGSGLPVAGSTAGGGIGAVGRFVPHHFDVAVSPACGSFSYAGQPFSVVVTARNGLAVPGVTLNHDGGASTSPNFAQATSLSDATAAAVGSFGATGAVAASRFNAGIASLSSVAYGFTGKLTPPTTIALRAVDADGVSSAGFAEGSMLLRSGWLRLSNAYGSELAALVLPVQALYWSGKAWVVNGADSCSAIPAAAIAKSNPLDSRGRASSAMNNVASAIALTGGIGGLSLSAASPRVAGSLDLAINLGSSGVDQSCLGGTRPATVGANLPWLRSLAGNCASSWDRDPAARASFGIFAPETRRTIDVRELF